MWAVKNPRPEQPTPRWLAGLALVPNQTGPRCQISSWNTPNPTEALLFEDEGNAIAAARLSGGEAVALGNKEAKQ